MSYEVKNGKLLLEGNVPHSQVLPFFPSYDPSLPSEGTIVDYRSPQNTTGHQQRGFIVHWALRGLVESGFYPGIDLGGGGVLTPGCISVDIIGSGETPAYGGRYDGVHIKADASKLIGFGGNSFSSIVSSHLIEHLACNKPIPSRLASVASRARKEINCKGEEIADIIQLWVDLLRSGGYIAAITPDEKWMEGSGSSFLFTDETHQHAFDSRYFKDDVLSRISGVEIVQYDTFDNHFSFDFVLRKL